MKWYKDLKVGVKLILGFIIVAIIAGIIGVVGVLKIDEIKEADSVMYKNIVEPLAQTVTFVESYQRMVGNVKDIILSDNEDEIEEYETRIGLRKAEFEEEFALYKETLLTEKGQELSDTIDTDMDTLYGYIDDISAYVRAGDLESAKALLYGDGRTIRDEIEESYRTLVSMKSDIATETAADNEDIAQSASTLMLAFLGGGIFISILLGIYISNILKKPINKLVTASEEIAKGNLDVTIDINTKDEIGMLAKSFTDMTNNINEVMGNINSASEQVAAGSRQVSESSMSLSQGATEQASSIEELTSSIEEIASQTRENASNSDEANRLSEEARGNASQGSVQMTNMLKAMDEINESSSNISKIIKVIDEIAFQTNILALNAAVEAARAGQHGKGFAVVAEEVRNLAARSANAAKETTAMIEGSISKVEDGTRIAKETSKALENIVDGVSKVAELVNHIAIASNEQALGVEQINQGIEQISDVVQTTSATSEETASASEELSGQAENLRNQVARFRLKKNNSNGSYRGMETINPEVLKMLDRMNDSKSEGEDDYSGNKSSGGRIALTDREFGKY